MKTWPLLVLISLDLHASELVRLDQVRIEAWNDQKKITLLISQNCSVCEKQLKILNDCAEASAIQVLVDGEDETKLRRFITRKKPPYSTYQLTPALKEELRFSDKTPALSLKSSSGRTLLEGLQSCAVIKSRI